MIRMPQLKIPVSCHLLSRRDQIIRALLLDVRTAFQRLSVFYLDKMADKRKFNQRDIRPVPQGVENKMREGGWRR